MRLTLAPGHGDKVQGFYFSRPVAMDVAAELLVSGSEGIRGGRSRAGEAAA